jgi:hypothetical protein
MRHGSHGRGREWDGGRVVGARAGPVGAGSVVHHLAVKGGCRESVDGSGGIHFGPNPLALLVLRRERTRGQDMSVSRHRGGWVPNPLGDDGCDEFVRVKLELLLLAVFAGFWLEWRRGVGIVRRRWLLVMAAGRDQFNDVVQGRTGDNRYYQGPMTLLRARTLLWLGGDEPSLSWTWTTSASSKPSSPRGELLSCSCSRRVMLTWFPTLADG